MSVASPCGELVLLRGLASEARASPWGPRGGALTWV